MVRQGRKPEWAARQGVLLPPIHPGRLAGPCEPITLIQTFGRAVDRRLQNPLMNIMPLIQKLARLIWVCPGGGEEMVGLEVIHTDSGRGAALIKAAAVRGRRHTAGRGARG